MADQPIFFGPVAYLPNSVGGGKYVVNPPIVHLPGVVGQVTSLPYTVPAGKELIITKVSIEGIYGAAIFIFVGDTFNVNTSIMTFTAPWVAADANGNTKWEGPGTRWWESEIHLAAGTKVGVALTNFAGADGANLANNFAFAYNVHATLKDVV